MFFYQYLVISYIGVPVISDIVYYDITRTDVHVPQSIERHVLCNICHVRKITFNKMVEKSLNYP